MNLLGDVQISDSYHSLDECCFFTACDACEKDHERLSVVSDDPFGMAVGKLCLSALDMTLWQECGTLVDARQTPLLSELASTAV